VNLLWWLGVAVVAVLGVAIIGGRILFSVRPDLAERAETLLEDGWHTLPAEEGLLEVDRAIGFLKNVRFEGDIVSEHRYELEDDVLTVFGDDGRVAVQAPLHDADRSDWRAFSTWPRLGLLVERDDRALRVRDVRDGGPAAAAGLQTGDTIDTTDGRPAVPMALRASLIYRLAGGELPLTVRRGDETFERTVILEPLMPAELLAGKDDLVGAWLNYAQARSDAVAR
jgi:hypothetical protein